MLRLTVLSAAIAVIGATTALAAPDTINKLHAAPVASKAPLASKTSFQVAEVSNRPKQAPMATKDTILYDIISDQISEMRRKSALPAVMCIAESNSDGSAETISRPLMAKLQADNASVPDSLFTLKQATECQSVGARVLDRETHERAMMIVAGPMEADMKTLMTGCGDYVGGFVRASGDSDFDFYTVHGGDVARKLGCELAQ